LKTNTSALHSIKHSLIPSVIVDKDIQIVEWSETLLHFFKLEKDLVLKELSELLADIADASKNQIALSENFTETIPVINRNGQERWIKVNAYPFCDKGEFFQISFDDVTFDKNQFDLAQQAKRMAKVGSWTVDLVNDKLFWSNMTKTIHEVSNDFIPDLEKGINFYKEGKHRDLIIKLVAECIESGKSFDEELIIVTAKGNEKWVRAIGNADRTNNKTIGLRGIFQDIDSVKRQQIEYERVNKRLRIAIDSANVGVWDFDIIHNNLIWDDKMYELYDVNKKDFNGVYDLWESTIHPEDKERAAFEVEQAINGKKELNTEFRIIKQDGSIAHIHAEAEVFWNKKGAPYRMIGANMDVTRMKRKDERLRHLLNVTEKQNQRLLNFTNIVSHNLRSNSSNISMLSGMLKTNLSADKQREFIEMIQTSSSNLDETIVHLNETIKIQATDGREIHQTPVKECIENVIESINALVIESSAKITIKIDESLKVNAIKPYLGSVFLNLLTNSIKYHNPKKQLKIMVTAKVLQNQTIISFSDNGIGIDLKKHGLKMFQMYKTFHNNKDAKGIGLFITKNHMEAMNGKIEVQSEPNQGSTFHLYFMNNSKKLR